MRRHVLVSVVLVALAAAPATACAGDGAPLAVDGSSDAEGGALDAEVSDLVLTPADLPDGDWTEWRTALDYGSDYEGLAACADDPDAAEASVAAADTAGASWHDSDERLVASAAIVTAGADESAALFEAFESDCLVDTIRGLIGAENQRSVDEERLDDLPDVGDGATGVRIFVSQREAGEDVEYVFDFVVVRDGAALGILFVGDAGEPFAADDRDEMLEISARLMEDL